MIIALNINQLLNGYCRGKTKDQHVWSIVLNTPELIGKTINLQYPWVKDIRPYDIRKWTTNEIVPGIIYIMISVNYCQDIPVTLKITVNVALTPIQIKRNTIHCYIQENRFCIHKFWCIYTCLHNSTPKCIVLVVRLG